MAAEPSLVIMQGCMHVHMRLYRRKTLSGGILPRQGLEAYCFDACSLLQQERVNCCRQSKSQTGPDQQIAREVPHTLRVAHFEASRP
jgi:hypothetical protein